MIKFLKCIALHAVGNLDDNGKPIERTLPDTIFDEGGIYRIVYESEQFIEIVVPIHASDILSESDALEEVYRCRFSKDLDTTGFSFASWFVKIEWDVDGANQPLAQLADS